MKKPATPGMGYIVARKSLHHGRYRLYFRGTRNLVPLTAGTTYLSAATARADYRRLLESRQKTPR